MVSPRRFLDLLVAAVELAATRSVLRELIRLADQAPELTEEQLRFRLLALAECAIAPSLAVPRSPAGRWLSETPDSAPGGQPAPHNMMRSAPSGRQAADPWRDAQGASLPVRAQVEQTDSDAELDALRSRLGQRGRMLRGGIQE
jgi:hypothetical protein